MNLKLNWDALGVGASLACAIHCAVLPLFLTSLPLFGFELLENVWLEAGMVTLASIVGIYSLYHGYRKHHHSFKPMIIFSIGFLFLVLKLFFVEYETWLLLPAVTGIVWGHLINYKSCRVHNHAHSTDCAHEKILN